MTGDNSAMYRNSLIEPGKALCYRHKNSKNTANEGIWPLCKKNMPVGEIMKGTDRPNLIFPENKSPTHHTTTTMPLTSYGPATPQI